MITDPRLTTGFLLDWGLAFDDLTHYDHKTGAPDSVISSAPMFRRAYGTLATASVNQAAGWLPSLRAVNRLVETASRQRVAC